MHFGREDARERSSSKPMSWKHCKWQSSLVGWMLGIARAKLEEGEEESGDSGG
jgi:hypothetical protein